MTVEDMNKILPAINTETTWVVDGIQTLDTPHNYVEVYLTAPIKDPITALKQIKKIAENASGKSVTLTLTGSEII